MTRLQQVIMGINQFSVGIVLPVLNLILLERGASLQTLPLLFVVYAVTVMCFEMPSGICADLYGRRTMFLLSCGFQLISFSLILVGTTTVWLVFAMIFNGLGRAFSSGSLDALIIDQAIERSGEEVLSKVTSRLAVLEGIGLGLGSILGGILAAVSGNYLINIVLRVVFTVVIVCLTLVHIREMPIPKTRGQRVSLLVHLKEGGQLVGAAPGLCLILGGVFFLGFFLSTLETYWQPAFMSVTTFPNSSWILGFIACVGFFAVTLGNIIAQRILVTFKNRWWRIFGISRIIFAVCLILFAVQKNSFGFIFGYMGIYLFMGVSNVTESTIINQLVPNHLRASLLSLNSFILQIGVMSAGIFSSFMIGYLDFKGIWLTAGILLIVYAVTVTVITFEKGNEKNKAIKQSEM
jgi:MFS family permease